MWSFLDFDQWTRNKNSIKKSELIELNILNLLLALWQVPLGNQVLGINVPKLGFWIGMAMEYYLYVTTIIKNSLILYFLVEFLYRIYQRKLPFWPKINWIHPIGPDYWPFKCGETRPKIILEHISICGILAPNIFNLKMNYSPIMNYRVDLY